MYILLKIDHNILEYIPETTGCTIKIGTANNLGTNYSEHITFTSANNLDRPTQVFIVATANAANLDMYNRFAIVPSLTH